MSELYRINSPGGYLERVAGWKSQEEKLFTVQDCWGLRRGQLLDDGAGTGLLPARNRLRRTDIPHVYPLVAHGETVGLLLLQRLHAAAKAQEIGMSPESKRVSPQPWARNQPGARQSQASRHAAPASLADLTGLYNRRFLEMPRARAGSRDAQTARFRSSCWTSTISARQRHFRPRRRRQFCGVWASSCKVMFAGAYRVRIGGEVALLLPEASLVTAYQLPNEYWTQCVTCRSSIGARSSKAITVSMGVAAFPKHGDTPEALIRAADQAHIQAKQGGRNKLASA
jgi:GGDEF domain-containing protein